MSDFYKLAEIDPDDFESVAGDADTLAGLLLELKGEFPILHEVINFDRYRFEILEMDARRIVKVKVTVGKKTERKRGIAVCHCGKNGLKREHASQSGR